MIQKILQPIQKYFQSKGKTIDYSQLIKNLQQNDLEENQKIELLKHLKEVQDEAHKQINASYEIPNLQKYLLSIPCKKLCFLAVEQFIGSRTSPKNLKTTQLYINLARQNAKNEQDLQDVHFYDSYLQKIEAQSKDDETQIFSAQDNIVQLAQKGHGVSQHLLAKELYLHAKEIQDNSIYQECAQLFQSACVNKSLHSFLYLGLMSEEGLLYGLPDHQYAYECYLIAASQDSPRAYFKLAQYHKNGTSVIQDNSLYVHYTKKAAELGLLESQHNLGCIYMEGLLVKQDYKKAMAWFNHAGSHGFSYSFFNLAQILEQGNADLQPNLTKSLEFLKKVELLNEIDVKDTISRIQQKLQQQ